MIKSFLKYVEIMTKITSLFVFLLTLAYFAYAGIAVNWTLTGLFFAGMFLFDLTTTAINNYIDTKTNDQELPLSRRAAFAVICALLGLSVFCGLCLAWMTDLVVLIVGGICFLCGIFYTYGPLPISRMPLGEVFSGLFYGLMIPFLMFYINLPQDSFLTLSVSLQEIGFSLKLWPSAVLLLLSAAPACTTANIMLANNICDLEKDILVKRHTLPYYLGVPRAVALFAWTYYAVYGAVALMAALRILHPVCLLFFLTLLPVLKNIQIFRGEQKKDTTFLCAIKNYIVMMSALVILVFLSAAL